MSPDRGCSGRCGTLCAWGYTRPRPLQETGRALHASRFLSRPAQRSGRAYASSDGRRAVLVIRGTMGLTGTGSEVDVVRFFLGTGIVPSLLKLKVLSERDNLCLYYLFSTTFLGRSSLHNFRDGITITGTFISVSALRGTLPPSPCRMTSESRFYLP